MRKIRVTDLDTNSEKECEFDRLVIATGASAIKPALPGITLNGVECLRTLNDCDRILRLIDQFNVKRTVLIGAGYIGLELAETFKNIGVEVCLIDQCVRIFPKMEAKLSESIQKKLVEQGVYVVLNDGVTKIEGKHGRVQSVVTQTGQPIQCDLVVLACGVKPNVRLAESSGIRLGPTGAIAVNHRMETNIEAVFAAGDCAESMHRVSDAPVWEPLGDIANLQGRVAGENAAGGHAIFPGVLGTSIFKTFDLQVGMTGLTEVEAIHSGFDVCSTMIQSRDRARYYPGGHQITLKLLAHKTTGKLLGAQSVGTGGVDKMINIAATALIGELSCSDLENADFAYAPPFSPVLSPIIVAASQLCKQVNSV